VRLLNKNVPNALGGKRIVAVVFDWAGTTVDFGSMAPVKTLQRVFEEAGVPVSEEEARRDMGIAKRDHIAAILAMPRIRAEWARAHGHEADASVLDALYQRFIPLQFDCLREYSQLIQDVPEVVERLRGRGIKIGSTTGYTRAMLDLLVAEAVKAGYSPDCSVTPEEAGAGRPHPFMMYTAAIRMQAYPMGAFVKVGDTVADIQEGLNAGAWSVGVAGTGNSAAMPRDVARGELEVAGAHFVINTLAELEAVITEVEARLNGKSAA
jgi:phosphonoacetaldehyde hydrolase